MALTPLEQTIGAINQSSRILIAPTAELHGDAVGSAFAFAKALEASGKEVCVLLPEDLPPRFSFLPAPKQVTREIPFDRDFIISINTKEVPVSELRYEQHEDALKLYLTAPAHFSLDHIGLQPGPHKHDLVVTFGASDMDSLGALFEKHPYMFYDIPLLNIDRNPGNERFGNINLVDVLASSVSEITHMVIEALNVELVSEEVATCLLAGILEGTKSFQEVSVTPRTMEIASKLLARGAKQTDVVRYLYKSRSIGQLRLWGRILGKLESIEDLHLAHATLQDEDFADLAINAKELPGVLEDLHLHFENFSTIALFYWYQNGSNGGNGNGNHSASSAPGGNGLANGGPHVRGLVSSREEHVLERIMQQFPAKRRGRLAIFKVPVELVPEAAKLFLEKTFGSALKNDASANEAKPDIITSHRELSGIDASMADAVDATDEEVVQSEDYENVEDDLSVPYASLHR
ncbi:MAG: hypothetical protein Q8Q39_01240 [bacterium]|nr:hypothetical protein [bacterium]